MKWIMIISSLVLTVASPARADESGRLPVSESGDAGVSRLVDDGIPPGLDTTGKRRIRPGLSATAAIDLVGRPPDERHEIGAACGMLEVLSWGADEMRIISVDGVVSSVAVKRR